MKTAPKDSLLRGFFSALSFLDFFDPLFDFLEIDMPPFQTRQSVTIIKAGDPNFGKAGVFLNWDGQGNCTILLDDGSTWVHPVADLKAL